eukprot:6128529-Prymnesium_polylepis.1
MVQLRAVSTVAFCPAHPPPRRRRARKSKRKRRDRPVTHRTALYLAFTAVQLYALGLKRDRPGPSPSPSPSRCAFSRLWYTEPPL